MVVLVEGRRTLVHSGGRTTSCRGHQAGNILKYSPFLVQNRSQHHKSCIFACGKWPRDESVCYSRFDAARLALLGTMAAITLGFMHVPAARLPRQGMLTKSDNNLEGTYIIRDNKMTTSVYNSIRHLSLPSCNLGSSKGNMETRAVDV